MVDSKGEFDLNREIIAGTGDVFSTMLMADIAGEPIEQEEQPEIAADITSMIGLGGDIRGMLAVHCPAAVAKSITGELLGMEVDELDEDVNDALGEIANMIAGNVKLSYQAAGLNVELAIPTAIVGTGVRISGLAGAHRYLVAFSFAGGRFWVELRYLPR